MRTPTVFLILLALGAALYAQSSQPTSGSAPSAPARFRWEVRQVVRTDAVAPLDVLGRMPKAEQEELAAASRKSSEKFNAELNKLGDEGWELVTVETTTTKVNDQVSMLSEVAYLKRMK